MNLLDTVRSSLWNWWLAGEPVSDYQRQTAQNLDLLRNYVWGEKPKQIKTKPGQPDDNVDVGFLGLIVERSISMLFGAGIDFDLPGDTETEQDLFIQSVWAASRQAILLHKVAQLACIYGTGYLKLLPVEYPEPGKPSWRLVSLNPRLMWIDTDAHDMEQVTAYTQRYSVMENGEDVAHKIVTERVLASAVNPDGSIYQINDVAGWQETHLVASRATGGKFQQTGDVIDWPYRFAPIVHWQNLPNAENVFGLSDLGQIIGLQDRYNFIQSNNSRIVRYHAHPKTWGRGTRGKDIEWGADKVVWLTGGGSGQPDPMLTNLEMTSDLASSRQLAQDIRQALFDIARTVDSSSMADALGQLTNFGLRVLYMDAINKNNTKRELYGEALLEVNRRLLVLAGAVGDAADPGAIVWPDPLPVNDQEQTTALTSDLGNGLVSKQTAAGKRGYDWESEQERMGAEQVAGDNVGAAVLRAFGQGR